MNTSVCEELNSLRIHKSDRESQVSGLLRSLLMMELVLQLAILLIFYPGECKSLYLEDVFILLKILNVIGQTGFWVGQRVAVHEKNCQY